MFQTKNLETIELSRNSGLPWLAVGEVSSQRDLNLSRAFLERLGLLQDGSRAARLRLMVEAFQGGWLPLVAKYEHIT